jgi:hypothetical protein
MIDITHEYKKRPRAFMGAGIIALSFIAALAISSAANRSVEVWALARAEPAGVILEPAMLVKVKAYLPQTLHRYIPAPEKITGRILGVGVGAGELIPRTGIMASAQSPYRREVPIKIGKIDLPQNLTSNDLVDLYLIPTKEGTAVAASELIAKAVRVISVDNRARDLGGDVGLLCDMDDKAILAFLTSYSSGRVIVVRHGQ